MTIKKLITIILIILVAACAGLGITITTKEGAKIEVNLKQVAEVVKPLIEKEDGTTEEIDVPTYETVETEKISEECPEGEECGKGAYIYAPTDSYIAFKDYTLGKCLDVDGHYGAQCWDLASVFWMNYTKDGRWLSTCGTGAAKGAWNCRKENAGTEFELIYNASEVQPGDWLIFTSGQYGHVGMALSSYNKGYVTLLGQNQGGVKCPGGGSKTNIISISTKSLAGAFRPKSYIKPTPAPAPAPVENSVNYTYKKGDQFGKVLLKLGLANKKNLWGKGGKVNEYNKQLQSQGIVVYRNGKYYGNIPIGKTIKLEK